MLLPTLTHGFLSEFVYVTFQITDIGQRIIIQGENTEAYNDKICSFNADADYVFLVLISGGLQLADV